MVPKRLTRMTFIFTNNCYNLLRNSLLERLNENMGPVDISEDEGEAAPVEHLGQEQVHRVDLREQDLGDTAEVKLEQACS